MNDDERFSLIFETYHNRISAYVRRRVPPAAVQDIVADTFMAAWHKLDRLGDQPLPWLFRTAALEISHRRRNDQRDQTLWERAAAAPWSLVWEDPAEEVIARNQWAAAFASLGESDREVLRLVVWDNLTQQEAAKVLGCTVVAFRVRLHRARRRLGALASDDAIQELGATSAILDRKEQP